MNDNNPIKKFNGWWQEALSVSPLTQKSAVCVSTIDANGFPTGRFVDLKQVDEQGFVFCTALDSQKGQDIQRNNKVAITIWWDHVGYQVRVTGTAQKINAQLADKFWASRSVAAQITSLTFKQSESLAVPESLDETLDAAMKSAGNGVVARPDNWGGFNVAPSAIEFLTFKESRLHLRKKFTKLATHWQIEYLQP